MLIFNNIYLLILMMWNVSCKNEQPVTLKDRVEESSVAIKSEGTQVFTGAMQPDKYVPLLRGLKVGMLVNTTSIVGEQHLVDFLREKKVNVTTIFAPEHGFRGDADAGADIANTTDAATGIPIISIYGKKKSPTKEDLAGLDVIIFDVQDVGARFYTYLSTLKYLMEACAEFKKPLMLLDRPNPNGHYVDGPVLEAGYESFVGIIPIPIVHGMTLGELAWMMNDEKMLKDGKKCELKIISCQNYDHQKTYILPVKPSPNLPNQLSIMLYPSICLFEGTDFSVGRGTDKQFQVYGSPVAKKGEFTFTPVPKPGAMSPFQQGKKCRGYDLTSLSAEKVKSEARINLSYILDAYKSYPDKANFFLKNNFINNLAGNKTFQQQIKDGLNEAQIRASWQAGLNKFKDVRKKYLLYPN